MSCGGNMMRAGQQPLAHLVDAAAVRWLAAEDSSAADKAALLDEITGLFGLGDRPEITYHGLRFLLTVSRNEAAGQGTISIAIHEIAQSG
jgi:hypothetical protein